MQSLNSLTAQAGGKLHRFLVMVGIHICGFYAS